MKVTNGLDLASQRVQNVAGPSISTDAANKAYVDAAVNGLQWKQPVAAASSSNITVSSPGTTFDSYVASNGDRILLMGQTAQTENGIYVFNGSSSALTRAADANTGVLLQGAAVLALLGSTNADKAFVQTTDPVTLGTSNIVFAQFGGGQTYTAGNGITLSGSQFSVNPGTGLTFSGSQLVLDSSVAVKKFAVAIGDGSSLTYTVTHNLGSRDVSVTVYDSASFNEVLADVSHATTNTVVVSFATAPATGAYRVVVHG